MGDLKKLGQEVDETNSEFLKKTDLLISGIKKDIKDAEDKFEENERTLVKSEKNAVDKMDETVLDFLED